MKAFKALILTIVTCPLLWAGAPRTTYEASDGTLYVLSPGPGTENGACGPIAGGFECTVDSETVVAVFDGLGCREKRGFAYCLVANGSPVDRPEGKSTLECDDKNYVLTDGGGGQCTDNNGESMTCQQVNSANRASASCDDGCHDVSGTGECTPVAKPENSRG